jgi:hypothetical protein
MTTRNDQEQTASAVRIARVLRRSIAAALFVILSAGVAPALPPAVELDRLMLHGKAALQAGSYDEAVDHFSRAKKLGIALPEDFALGYATALAGAGKVKEAKAVLDAYFTKYGTKGASYKEVLKLLVQIEDQEQGKVRTATQAAPATTPKAEAIPARPQVPFTLSEDVWRVLEASEAYRSAPRPRGYRISYQANEQTEYTGSKTKALKKPDGTTKTERIEATSLTSKCAMIRSSNSAAGKLTSTETYVCGGFICLGTTGAGKTIGYITELDELTGSLFPMRVGNRISVRYRSAYLPDRKYDMSMTGTCRVTSQRPAIELHPRLKGTAWKIQCSGSYMSNDDKKINPTPEIDDYYLEDLGLQLSAIGRLNYREKKYILPQPGDQTELVAEGEYGSRSTTTITGYDWSVDTEAPEKGR